MVSHSSNPVRLFTQSTNSSFKPTNFFRHRENFDLNLSLTQNKLESRMRKLVQINGLDLLSFSDISKSRRLSVRLVRRFIITRRRCLSMFDFDLSSGNMSVAILGIFREID
jgi:hypothetical protein